MTLCERAQNLYRTTVRNAVPEAIQTWIWTLIEAEVGRWERALTLTWKTVHSKGKEIGLDHNQLLHLGEDVRLWLVLEGFQVRADHEQIHIYWGK